MEGYTWGSGVTQIEECQFVANPAGRQLLLQIWSKNGDMRWGNPEYIQRGDSQGSSPTQSIIVTPRKYSILDSGHSFFVGMYLSDTETVTSTIILRLADGDIVLPG